MNDDSLFLRSLKHVECYNLDFQNDSIKGFPEDCVPVCDPETLCFFQSGVYDPKTLCLEAVVSSPEGGLAVQRRTGWGYNILNRKERTV